MKTNFQWTPNQKKLFAPFYSYSSTFALPESVLERLADDIGFFFSPAAALQVKGKKPALTVSGWLHGPWGRSLV